jgi:hypothetical protein
MTTPTEPQSRAVLERLLDNVERQLLDSLDEARVKFRQSTDKGTSVEREFRAVLRDYLPRHLGIGHGEVIDTDLRRSAQTDVVVASQDHPFTFKAEAPGLFFIEGVLAAGEIKSVLTTAYLESAIQNSRRFKALTPKHTPASTVRSNPSDLARFCDRRPWFVAAFESQLSIEAIAVKLESESGTGAGTRTDLVDAVFVLGRGYLINFGDGAGALKATSAGANVQGWGWWEGGPVLATALGWLSAVMPTIQRYDPILPLYLLPSK